MPPLHCCGPQSSKQSGKENKVQEDLQTLRQQLATEKGEHDLTKQRLLGMLRTQRVRAISAIIVCFPSWQARMRSSANTATVSDVAGK